MSLRPDCRNRSRGVWLIKVPKYLSQHWKRRAGSAEVGKLIWKNNGGEPITKFYVTNRDQCSSDSGFSSQSSSGSQPAPLPTEYDFKMQTNIASLGVIREEKPDKLEEIDGKQSTLTLEGKVVLRADCNPVNNDAYQKFKKELYANINRPTNQVQSIDKAEIKFKPISRHAEHIIAEKAKKDNKNVRLEKTALLDLLFQAFEKHQYYKLYDLARVTAQPPNYLKEVLQEIAIYNTMPPHKYTWELKEEYRHYKDDSGMDVSTQ